MKAVLVLLFYRREGKFQRGFEALTIRITGKRVERAKHFLP
jgi:hypothetical protein